ncbi:aldehyde dehydrogenase family protein [Litorivicinus sp.]|nr:aldehyde dehydrogenase family protein [Litorivicinus sp.]MDB9862646.1 aldehyde dehydrogenase family protein [Litorivicinus sp.]MDC1207883.1 aldehyde dehydrogenase family protein [Litorivicinus sp.]
MSLDPRFQVTKQIEGRMLINGELRSSGNNSWLKSFCPATQEYLGRVPNASAEEMQEAVAAATEAAKSWRNTSQKTRVELIEAIAAALEARADEFAYIESLDTGNTHGPMKNDVHKAVERMRFYCGLAYEIKGMTVPSTPENIHLTLREPYGVVGRIIPFNHPIGFAASRISPALISGNTIIVKPSEQAPLSASLLAEICAELAPPGVINIVTGDRVTGDALVRDPRVKRIAFIGSVASGMAIQRAAAETCVKHVSLELGGKNPFIICKDANLDDAVKAATNGMNFGWQGQSCGSTSRLIIHRSQYEELSAKVVDRVRSVKVGHPLDPDINMGPVVSQAQYEKVLSYMEIAKEGGADLLLGGKALTIDGCPGGFFVEPTVFGNVNSSMRIAQEEVFGPIMSLMPYDDIDEAVDIANSTTYGLTAAVWTNDYYTAMDLSRRIEAGYVWINGIGNHYRGLPYGGYKNSGIGREEGLDEMLSYTEVKAINFAMGQAERAKNN